MNANHALGIPLQWNLAYQNPSAFKAATKQGYQFIASNSKPEAASHKKCGTVLQEAGCQHSSTCAAPQTLTLSRLACYQHNAKQQHTVP